MSPQTASILHAIDTTGPGGAETVFLQLVEKLKIPGFDNIAIIKGPGWVEDQLKSRGIHYFIIKPSGFLSLSYYIQLIKIIRQHRVKLIQANLLGSTLTYAIVSLFTGTPLIATLHGRVDINPSERFVKLKNFIMRAGVNQLVAVSKDLATYIQDRNLFDRAKIAVVYNGIETQRYAKNSLQTLRDRLSLPASATLVGCVGNVRPAKDYGNLISAAKIILAVYPDTHFVIAGHQKPELMAKLTQQIETLAISNNIHFLGFQNNTAEFLGQLDFFALSSSSEGFSIATIEAMASQLPIVATRCGGPEEILEQRATGILVPPSNSEALAQALLELMQDSVLAKGIALAGTAHVRETFSAEAMLNRYAELYAQHLQNPAQRQ